MTDQPSICPHCGKPASQKLLGMCPECMLKAGLGGATAEASIPSAAGRFVPPAVQELGRYFPQLEILELIGRGGMGAVYKARQKQLDRIVALKILPPGIGGGNAEGRMQNAERGDDAGATAFAERFTREAKALAALAHPNIVTLYEFGQTDGLFFFLMEFVDGVNLRQLLSGGKLAPKEALAIVPHICDALQYAHDRGIVHRDIKPENILLGRDGVVKIADFGVAKIVGRSDAATKRRSDEGTGTQPAAVGTPAYMAPEQVDRPAEVDHRADIYSLGVVLYQMLTGELPGKQIEPPSRKVQIDVRIDEIVMRALEHNPGMRYSQASVFKTEVETIAGEGTEGRTPKDAPLAAGEAFDSGKRFSRTAIAGAVGIALSAMAICWIATISGQNAGVWQSMKSVEKLGLVLTESLFVLGFLVSPLATPTLGWIAVVKIRRSRGRLRGMWLAVLDGLIFPLLAIDGLLMWGSNALFHYYRQEVVLGHGEAASTSPVVTRVTHIWSPTILLLTVLLVAGLDVLIAWTVWRTVKKPMPLNPLPAPVKEQTDRVLPARREIAPPANRRVAWILAAVTFALHTAVFLALLIFAAFVIPHFEAIFKDFRTELPLLTRMTIALTHGVQGFWYLMIPLFMAGNAGICILLGYLNARKSLIAWLICGVALLLVVAGAMSLSLSLPMQGLLQIGNSPSSTSVAGVHPETVIGGGPAPYLSTQPATTSPDVLPELDRDSAKGLVVECHPSYGEYRVGERVLLGCVVANTTKTTKPIGYNTHAGSHFILVSGAEAFAKPSKDVQVFHGGIMAKAIPNMHEPLTVRSGHPETEQILYLPGGKSIEFLLDCGPAGDPQDFTGRIVYDPVAPSGAFILLPGEQPAFSNVFTYRVTKQNAHP